MLLQKKKTKFIKKIELDCKWFQKSTEKKRFYGSPQKQLFGFGKFSKKLSPQKIFYFWILKLTVLTRGT